MISSEHDCQYEKYISDENKVGAKALLEALSPRTAKDKASARGAKQGCWGGGGRILVWGLNTCQPPDFERIFFRGGVGSP